jgi:hypothetical protein
MPHGLETSGWRLLRLLLVRIDAVSANAGKRNFVLLSSIRLQRRLNAIGALLLSRLRRAAVHELRLLADGGRWVQARPFSLQPKVA